MSVLNATVSLKNEENIFLTTSFPSSSPTWILACEPDAISFHFISSMIAFEKYFTPKQLSQSKEREKIKEKHRKEKGKEDCLREFQRESDRALSGQAHIFPHWTLRRNFYIVQSIPQLS